MVCEKCPVRSASSPEAAHSVIRNALPPIIAAALEPAHFERIRQSLLHLPHVSKRPRLTRDDWRGATGVLLLVLLSTFPVVAPFFFTANVHRALRISNLIAVVM